MTPDHDGTITPVPPGEVRGGAAGLAAQYAEMRALATAYDTAGNRQRDQAGLGSRVLADTDLLQSALLSPLTFADAEAAVLAATLGPDGLLVASLAWEADALLVRVTIEAFESTDELVRLTFEVVDYSLGRLAGFALGAAFVTAAATAPLWLPPLALDAAGAATIYGLLPPALQERLRKAGGRLTDDLTDDVQQWLVDHPGAVQHLVNGGGGVIDGFWDGVTPGPWGFPPVTPTTEDAAGLLAGLYPPDGPPHVDVRDDLSSLGGSQPVPGSLADVMTHLDQVNGWSDADHPADNGTIEIQTWTGGDGVPHHIVYLPGTDDLTTLPWTADDDVRDLPTNLLALNGQSTTYAEGILSAMHQAGIAPTDTVMLAGHSQGGIEAAWIASHSQEFHVTQVVTAGSPVAGLGDYPPGTQVLSLEHHGDVVPLLDGEDNSDAANHVTVTFDDHETSVGGNHALSHYVNGAAGVDASTHPSLTAALADLHDDGFLTGETTDVAYQAFQITRRP
ncbi:hypothetical protein [Nocardioides sp.]|uniref:hypothetical protein n=1 Tax=Nocardioides sp. TaxID=35761 RepID=UPI00352737C5